MKKQINLGMLLTITCALVLGGCSSPNPYGDAYGSSDTRKVQQVYYGTVEKVEPVTIDALPNPMPLAPSLVLPWAGS